jgi:hypothetical protein
MAELDGAGNTKWSSTGFKNTFKRKGRRNNGSDTTSIASSGTLEKNSSVDQGIDRVATIRRRSSTDSSSRRLSKVLTNKLRRTKDDASSDGQIDPLSSSMTTDDPSSSLYSSTAVSDEGPIPLVTEDSGNFTEDSDSEV